MSKNDDALRCAEALERCDCIDFDGDFGASASHIRALVAENEAQAALLRQAVYALSYHQEQTRPIFNTQQAIAAIRQHLEGKS